MILPEQSRAGRALLAWSQSDLANHSRISKKTIADFESGNRAYHARTAVAVRTALEANGVQFIPQNGGGAGVRLRIPMPRLFRRNHVDGRGWVAFAFDYRGARHTAFVTDTALVRIALDNIAEEAIFDMNKARILLAAADKVDAGDRDTEGHIVIGPDNLNPVEFDSDEVRAKGEE